MHQSIPLHDPNLPFLELNSFFMFVVMHWTVEQNGLMRNRNSHNQRDNVVKHFLEFSKKLRSFSLNDLSITYYCTVFTAPACVQDFYSTKFKNLLFPYLQRTSLTCSSWPHHSWKTLMSKLYSVIEAWCRSIRNQHFIFSRVSLKTEPEVWIPY